MNNINTDKNVVIVKRIYSTSDRNIITNNSNKIILTVIGHRNIEI